MLDCVFAGVGRRVCLRGKVLLLDAHVGLDMFEEAWVEIIVFGGKDLIEFFDG